MHIARKSLIKTYYYATLPWRLAVLARASRSGCAPTMILYYHRVADVHPTPWTIARKSFARQIDWLSRRFELISLADAQRRVSGRAPHPAVCITFDDGYAENCDFALPLLIERRIPVTYFVSTHFVKTGEPFPHDRALGLDLAPNTSRQLSEWAAAGVEIGAHTHRHADLGEARGSQELRDEIVAPRAMLEAISNRPVRYFAFPFGQRSNLSAAAWRLARRAGYQAVCSAYGGYNFPGDNPFHLQRIHGDPELARLKNWLTYNPKHVFDTPRWDVHTAAELPVERPVETESSRKAPLPRNRRQNSDVEAREPRRDIAAADIDYGAAGNPVVIDTAPLIGPLDTGVQS